MENNFKMNKQNLTKEHTCDNCGKVIASGEEAFVCENKRKIVDPANPFPTEILYFCCENCADEKMNKTESTELQEKTPAGEDSSEQNKESDAEKSSTAGVIVKNIFKGLFSVVKWIFGLFWRYLKLFPVMFRLITNKEEKTFKKVFAGIFIILPVAVFLGIFIAISVHELKIDRLKYGDLNESSSFVIEDDKISTLDEYFEIKDVSCDISKYGRHGKIKFTVICKKNLIEPLDERVEMYFDLRKFNKNEYTTVWAPDAGSIVKGGVVENQELLIQTIYKMQPSDERTFEVVLKKGRNQNNQEVNAEIMRRKQITLLKLNPTKEIYKGMDPTVRKNKLDDEINLYSETENK